MSRINPRTMDDFEAIEIDGMQFGWTQFRIDKSKLPKGVHAYDVMYDDEGDNPFMIKQDVIVDFMGSVISRDELPSNSIWIDKKQMVRYVEDLENWTYLDGIYTYPEMLRRLKKGYVFNQSKYRRKKQGVCMSIIGYNNNGWTVTTASMCKNGFGVALAQKVNQYVTWLYYINRSGGFNFISGDYFTKEDSALESYRKKIDKVLA